MRRVIEDTKLAEIADAIRTKTGRSFLITVSEMPSEILSIFTDGGAYDLYAGKEAPAEAADGDFWVDTSDEGGSVDEGYLIRLVNGTLTAEDKLPDGITEIRGHVFAFCTSLALTALPGGLTSIGDYAFAECTSLALTTLPEGLTSIGEFAFYGCTSLALTALPGGLTSIGDYAFAECTSLALTALSEGLTSIGEFAFAFCTSMEKLTFKGTPTTINDTAFYDCTNLTTINVPWAEGAVANAPWGATNAVINYNYTGE